MEMPYFHFENLAEFCVWCAMVHQQGFASVYSPQMCHSTPNTRVHHTKCTITHTHAGIYIYIYINMHRAQRYHTEQENKPNIANVPRVWPSKVREK